MTRSNNIIVTSALTDISIFFPYETGNVINAASQIDKLRKRIEDSEHFCGTTLGGARSKFRYSSTLWFSRYQSATVRFGSLDPLHKGGGIELQLSVERNPTALDLRRLGARLKTVLGDDLGRLCRDAVAISATISVEISEASLSWVTPRYTPLQGQSVQFNMYDMSGRVRAVHFGAVPSALVDESLYDGKVGTFPQKVQELADAEHKVEQTQSNRIWCRESDDLEASFPLEIEQVYELHTPLRALGDIESRMSCFSFGEDIRAEDSALSNATAFFALADERGIDYAFNTLPVGEQGKASAWWASRQAKWWKPELHWQPCLKQLSELGTFIANGFTGKRKRR